MLYSISNSDLRLIFDQIITSFLIFDEYDFRVYVIKTFQKLFVVHEQWGKEVHVFARHCKLYFGNDFSFSNQQTKVAKYTKKSLKRFTFDDVATFCSVYQEPAII